MSLASLWVDTGSTLEKVIWALFVGIVIASFMLWYTKGYIGRVARALAKREIYSSDKAVTLSELGYDSFFFRRALTYKYSALRKVVYCTEEKERLTRDDFKTAGFYIPEEQRNRAYFKYKGNNTTLPMVLIVIVAMFIVANLCVVYIPKILELFK